MQCWCQRGGKGAVVLSLRRTRPLLGKNLCRKIVFCCSERYPTLGKLAPTKQTSSGTTPARVHSMHLSLKNVSIHFPSFYYLAWKLAGEDFSRCKLWSCFSNYSHFQVIRSSQFPRPIPRTTFSMQIAQNKP